jgi:hypothetical protein
MAKVILSPDGEGKRIVDIDSIHIPDLWPVAMALRDYSEANAEWSEQVLEVWHLAHDLKKHIQNLDDAIELKKAALPQV